jgi:hypothetical protein
MRLLDIARLNLAAITIQSVFRSWTCQKELMLRREQLDQTQAVSAAIEIQAFVRSRYRQKMLYEQRKNAVAATSIQSLVRSWACQRELRRTHAIMRSSEIAKLTSAAITVHSMLRS